MAWRSQLQLGFTSCAQSAQTRLTSRHHQGALRVQRALYPETDAQHKICHILMLYPPAGLAYGDDLSIRIDLQDDAQVLLTTPGANKWYGQGDACYDALSAATRQQVYITLQAQARLEWLPQENCFYNGCHAHSINQFVLAPEASVIAWEINLLGRRLSDEQWVNGYMRLRNLFWRQYDDEMKLICSDTLNKTAQDAWFKQSVGLANHAVFGTLWAIAPLQQQHQLKNWLDSLRQTIAEHRLPLLVTMTEQAIMVRYLGEDARQCLLAMDQIRGILRQLMWQQRQHIPRIWQT